jgi:predicted PP-loop superfamily ATPase
MKLYTEEQVKEIYFKGVHNGRLHIEGKCSDEVESLTPIQLPSDEEIVNKALEIKWSNTLFKDGAKFVIDKIQGGEQ